MIKNRLVDIDKLYNFDCFTFYIAIANQEINEKQNFNQIGFDENSQI
jgi:hypothetical protein